MIAWNSVNFLNLAGLIYDIAGAVMLARAVILNPKQKIAQQVATSWNYNKHMIPAVIEGKLEGIAGLAILVVGFILQILGTLGWSGNIVELGALMVALAAALVIFRAKLPIWKDAQAQKVIAFIEESRKKSSG